MNLPAYEPGAQIGGRGPQIQEGAQSDTLAEDFILDLQVDPKSQALQLAMGWSPGPLVPPIHPTYNLRALGGRQSSGSEAVNG